MSKPIRNQKHHKNSSRHAPQWRTSQPNIELNDDTFYDIYAQHHAAQHQLVPMSEEEQLRIALEHSGNLFMYEQQQRKKAAELERIRNLRTVVEVVKFQSDDHADERKDADTSTDSVVSEVTENEYNAPVAYTEYEYSNTVNELLERLCTMLEHNRLQSLNQMSVLRNAVIDNDAAAIDLLHSDDEHKLAIYADTLLQHEQECVEIQQQELQVMQSMYDNVFVLHTIQPVCYTVTLKHDSTDTSIDINVFLPTIYPVRSRCSVRCYVSPRYTAATTQLQTVIVVFDSML